MGRKIPPNAILEAIDKAMAAAGMSTAQKATKGASKTTKKVAKKAAAPKPVSAAKKVTKKAAAPKAAAPKRADKQIENIMAHNPDLTRAQAVELAGMTRSQRREFNATMHRAKTEAKAAEKKAGREATQAQNRIEHRKKNEAKMNSYQKWKAEQAAKSAEPVVPKQKRSRKKGAK